MASWLVSHQVNIWYQAREVTEYTALMCIVPLALPIEDLVWAGLVQDVIEADNIRPIADLLHSYFRSHVSNTD
jgi:hypothetical protein